MNYQIMPPNMIQRKWTWKVSGVEGTVQGKASSEPEAWRLANDAAKHLKRKYKGDGISSQIEQIEKMRFETLKKALED